MARIFLSPPHMGPDERALLLEAFDSNWIAPLGPHVDAFEKETAAKVGVAHAAALASGTAALHLGLILLGVGPGDEVFVSDLTFAASVNVIRYVGAIPVFIDANAETWTMDPELLAEAMEARARAGRLPKAVLPVDLYGQCCDYERIGAICQRYDVPILQDASEALGATYRGQPAGQQGAMAALSFNGNKILTTSGGGMLLSQRADWIVAARHLATQAREPAAHYEHRLVGYNYRLSNLLAAVGRGQMRVLEQRVAARQANYAWYERHLGNLPGWQFMPEASYGTSNRWLTCVTVDPEAGPDREHVRRALEREDIEARPVWKPMHMQPVFSSFPVYGGRVGRTLFENGLCLPSGSSLQEEDRQRIAAIILAAVEGKAGGA